MATLELTEAPENSGNLSVRITRRALRHESVQQCSRYLKSSPLGYRVLSGVAWSVIGTGFSRALTMIGSIVVARALGKTGFGQLGMIQSTVGMFGVLAGAGLGSTATKYIAQYRSTSPERVGRIITLSSILSWTTSGAVALVLLALAPWLVTHTLGAPSLLRQMQVGTLLLLLGGIAGAQSGVLSGFEAFREIARINSYVAVFSLATLIAGVYFWQLTGAVWALVLNLAANCVMNYFSVRKAMHERGIPVVRRNLTSELPMLWRFSLPVTLVALMVVPSFWLSSTFLALGPGGYAAMGEFSAATQWRNLILTVPSLFAGVAVPTLSNLLALRDRVGYNALIGWHLLVTAVVAAVAAGGVALFAGAIARSYGSGFAGAAVVIRWMALSGFLMAVNTVVGSAISSLGRAWTGLFFGSLCALILLISAYFLVPVYGARGLAWAHVFAYFLHSFWQGAFLFYVLKGRFDSR